MTKPTAIVEKVFSIARSLIEPDPNQPRKEFDAAELKALAKSLQEEGQREPILVRAHPTRKGRYILVNGERRWRASESVMSHLDARIETEKLDAADLLILQATLNSGKPLTPFEEADLCYELHHVHKISQQEIADRLGLKRSTVGDRVRLGELPKVWQDPIRRGKLSISHAPIIQRFLPIPEKHQAKLAKATLEGLANTVADEDRPPSVEDFEEAIEEAAFEFLAPMSGTAADLTPKQYGDGPVVELPAYKWSGSKTPRRFAADPERWTPLVEEAQKASEASHAKAVDRNKRAMSADEKRWAADRKRQAAALKKKLVERRAQFAAVARELPQILDEAWTLFSIRWLIEEMHNDTLRNACKTLGLEGKKGQYGSWDFRAPIIKHAESLSFQERTRLLLTLHLMPDVSLNQYDTRGPRRLKAAAELLGIDLARVELGQPLAEVLAGDREVSVRVSEEGAQEVRAAIEAETGNGERPNKWQRRNKRGKAKHAPDAVDTPESVAAKASLARQVGELAEEALA
jgi:ParB/RepB/Spo0J family partition protein